MLNISHLQVSYGAARVIGDLSLPTVMPGSITAVLGPNGAGKSTLLKAIAGLASCRGTVILNDENITAKSQRARSQMIGYLPQTLPLPTTLVAYEAVLSACRSVRSDLSRVEAEKATEDTFDRLGIRHLAMRGLDQLSGGQRQMVGLAQVIVREPPVMLLDEPTSALDLRWQLGLFDVVKSITRGRTACCLVALHDINLAMRHCDQIILLRDGDLVAAGLPAEAMTEQALHSTYAVEGRIETCRLGTPYVIADRVSSDAALGN